MPGTGAESPVGAVRGGKFESSEKRYLGGSEMRKTNRVAENLRME